MKQQVLTENKMGMGRTSGKNISVHLENAGFQVKALLFTVWAASNFTFPGT
jgi:hypothetical protein